MIEKLFNRQAQETEEHWVSISDVMAGLMVIFLFIAISYMMHANRETEQYKREKEQLEGLKKQVESLIDVYRDSRRTLSEALQEEFGDDLLKWPGSLNMGTLSIRFKNPFAQGEAEVPNSFKHVLRDFFPRYIKILTKPEYKDEIAEIRIEGHTSSEWRVGGEDLAYYYNMELSQDRARKVLEYVLEITDSRIKDHKEWIKEYLTANGLSSSKLIPNEDETPNQEASRRVEFRVVTKSEELITELEALIETFNDLIRSGN